MLIAACLRQLEEWGVTRQDAGGDLPVRGVYGVPEQWPHVRALYRRAGFAPAGATEVVYLARVDDLPRPARPAGGRAGGRRSVGMNGTRLSAVLGEQGRLHRGGHLRGRRAAAPARRVGRIGNLHVSGGYRRRGVGDLAARAGGGGCGWPRSAGSWITPRSADRPGRTARLPGVPGRVGLHRAHPDPARLDPHTTGPVTPGYVFDGLYEDGIAHTVNW